MVEIGLLSGAKLDAGVDAVEGFGEGSLGGFDGVGGEEGGDLVAFLLGAEGARGGDDADSGVGSELGADVVPVVADVVPGLLLGFAGLPVAQIEKATALFSQCLTEVESTSPLWIV